MNHIRASLAGALVAVAGLLPAQAPAETVKIGAILTTSGAMAFGGDMMTRAINLYLKQHQGSLPKGTEVRLVYRDDGGPNPDTAKRLAQELIAREKVQFLTGFVWTPNANAVAPLATEGKVPTVIMNATGTNSTRLSPYFTRVSFTNWQPSYHLGRWAAERYKRAYVLVTDFTPGHDTEAAFVKGFTEKGGSIMSVVRMPIQSPNFIPFLQRAKEAKPDVLFAFNPGGPQATAFMRAYHELGLRQANVPLIGPGDLTTEEELRNMGEAALGTVTAHHYSLHASRPANKAFLEAWRKEYGANAPIPNYMAIAAWDGMDAIFYAIKKQAGKVDPDKSMAALKEWSNPNSPRGPVRLDPQTRDVVHNMYVREVKMVDGRPANVEFVTIPDVRDPGSEPVKQ